MNTIQGVLFKVPSGEAVDLPLGHLAIFGVTRDSGKTTFIESAVDASKFKAITFRTKRGEIGFDGAKQLPLFFDERGLTHWKALEGLIAATLEEKVSHEPGIRGGIITVCTEPVQAVTLEEVHERVKAQLETPKIRGFVRDVFNKLNAYLNEVLPQIRQLRPRLTNQLNLTEQGVYVEDLTGLADEIQSLLLASLMKKCYESCSGIIVVVPEVWKFLPQDRGSPVKWVIEKYVREMGVVQGYLWIDAQDLRGVDKKHLRSIDVRLFGRQPDPHEIEDLLKALPLPRNAKPSPEQIMKLKLGHFYAKLKDDVVLVYVRPRWLPEAVAVKVARGEIPPDGTEVQRYKPECKPDSRVSEENDMVYKEECERLNKELEEERKKREEVEKEFARQLEHLSDKKAEAAIAAFKKDVEKEISSLKDQLADFEAFKRILAKVILGGYPDVGVPTPSGEGSEVSVSVQPTLTEFTVKTPGHVKLEATDKGPQGQILILASKGFFSEGRKSNHVRAELERAFNSRPRPGTVETILAELVPYGILTRTKEGKEHSWIYVLSPTAQGLLCVE